MKFDHIIGNPPYQSLSSNGKKTHPLWHKFVAKAFELCVHDGYVVLVHPSGWRNPSGSFVKTKDLLLTKDVEYLEIHDIDDGKKTFGAATRYDWYCIKNCPPSNKTIVKFQDGTTEPYDLTSYSFIPNLPPRVFKHLLASNEDDVVDFIYDSSKYHTQNTDRMSKVKTDTHKFPVVNNVGIKGDATNIWWSNEDIGHFNSPKVILGVFNNGVIIDDNGEYGLSEHCTGLGMSQICSGIADKVNNLPALKKALQHPDFITSMQAFNVGGIHTIFNRKIMKLLKKDFWKNYITTD